MMIISSALECNGVRSLAKFNLWRTILAEFLRIRQWVEQQQQQQFRLSKVQSPRLVRSVDQNKPSIEAYNNLTSYEEKWREEDFYSKLKLIIKKKFSLLKFNFLWNIFFIETFILCK